MKKNFKVIDLRGQDIASADLKILYPSGFSLLIKINEEKHEAHICGCEISESYMDLVIPSSIKKYSITSIDKGAFTSCQCLSSIVIPNSVSSIGSKAFYSCPKLTAVTIPGSVTKIGVNAFGLCDSLETIVTDHYSLLDGSGISEKVDIQSWYYKQIIDTFKQNENAPANPEFVKLAHSIAFSPIIKDFADRISRDDSIDYKKRNELLLKSFLMNKDTLFSVDFGFVKYLHIFNRNKTINLFIDYPKEIITTDKKEIGTDNMIFEDRSLIKIMKNAVGLMGGGVIEFCAPSSEADMVLDPCYYPVISVKSNRYYLSDYLNEWCNLTQNDLKEVTPLVSSLQSFLKKNKNVTHVFFLGNYGQKLDYDYSLLANIGVDCTNVKEKKCVQSFLDQLQKFLHRISVQIEFSFENIKLLEEHRIAKEKSTISAGAHAINRNLKHNFGAHVLTKYKSKDAYYNLKKMASKKTYISCYKDIEIDSGEQFSYFFDYLDNRMSYLSELTFGVSNILVAKKIYSDVFKELDRTRLLLNYISGVSSFKYKFCLSYNNKPLNNENDITVAFPGDMSGCQAFYNIIENIIRNTAKHSIRNNESQIIETFNIDFSDKDDYPEFYCVEIDNGIKVKNITTLVNNQNSLINKDIIDNKNWDLRTYGLGIVEIKESAAFLRQIDFAKIDTGNYNSKKGKDNEDNRDNPILLEAINKKGALGYRFYLKKPKEFLFVGDNWDRDIEKTSKKELENLGIYIVNSNSFENQLIENKEFPYQFLLYNESISKKAKEMLSDNNDCKTLLPVRKLKLSFKQANEIERILKESPKEEFLNQLKILVWGLHYRDLVKDVQKESGEDYLNEDHKTPNHVIFLNHASADSHSGKWKEAQKLSSFETWVENLSSQSSTKLPEFNRISSDGVGNEIANYITNISYVENDENDENEWIRQSLFAAYHDRVVVIDERIQSHSNDYEKDIRVGDLYLSTNIRFPDPSTMPLEPNEFDETAIKDIESFINNYITNSFLLIHYGILERMYKKEGIINRHLKEWSTKAKRLVVTSGRGAHSLTLPPSVCFVDFSSVSNVFITNRNKYIIDNLLHQARRKK